jgi:hypothetical protein
MRHQPVLTLPDLGRVDIEQVLERDLARYPGARDRSEAEMRFFFVVGHNLQAAELPSLASLAADAGVVTHARAAGMTRHELSRRFVARWSDERVQRLLLEGCRFINAKELAVLRADPEGAAADLIRKGLPSIRVFWMLEDLGHGSLIEQIRPDLEHYQELADRLYLTAARIAFDRFVLRPGLHLAMQRARRVRMRLARRLQEKQRRYRSLQVDLHALLRARKEARGRTHRTEQALDGQLALLQGQISALRQAEAAAEERHSAALSTMAHRHEAELAAMRGRLARQLGEYAAALAVLSSWTGARPLEGKAIAVVGDDSHAVGYRVLVEAAGGSFVHVTAMEKFGRIGSATAGADLVMMMTAHAKHAAEKALRKAVRGSRTLVLRCPTAGLAAFSRVLREEALPRLLQEQAAGGKAERGGA